LSEIAEDKMPHNVVVAKADRGLQMFRRYFTNLGNYAVRNKNTETTLKDRTENKPYNKVI